MGGLHGEGGVQPGSEACGVSADVCLMGLEVLAGPRTWRRADPRQGWVCGPGPRSLVSAWTGPHVPHSCQPPWSCGSPGARPQGPAARGCGEAGQWDGVPGD